MATTADADFTIGGATYTKEDDVLGNGLYDIGDDTLTYVGGGGGGGGGGERDEGTFETLFGLPVVLKAHAMAGGMASSGGKEPTGEQG